MAREITYRDILEDEEAKFCQMVGDCFKEYVAPDYSQEGINEFFKYLTPKHVAYRLEHEHFILVASDLDVMVGAIEVRKNYHISLLFVRKEYQKRGIAKKLFELSVDRCRRFKPDITFIEVNSSPYAVSIYKKLGFTEIKAEQTVNGMRITPMIFRLD
jgi:GNAT superfamily N-acetyltransferase